MDYSAEQLDLGILNDEYRAFLFSIIYEKECNQYYNHFWLHTRKKLYIDAELKSILNNQDFFAKFSKKRQDFFKNEENYGFETFGFGFDGDNRGFTLFCF